MEGKGKRARKVFKMAPRHHLQISGPVTSAELSDGCGGESVGRSTEHNRPVLEAKIELIFSIF